MDFYVTSRKHSSDQRIVYLFIVWVCFDEHTLHDHVMWNLDKFFSSSLTKKNICQSKFFLLGYIHTIGDSFSCRHEKLSAMVRTFIWYVPLHFGDRGGAASLRNRNCTEIAVLMCEQRPRPVWFSRRRKSYTVECEDSLRTTFRVEVKIVQENLFCRSLPPPACFRSFVQQLC